MSEEIKPESKGKKWEKILVHELFEFLLYFAFLSFFLISFAWYRRFLLASYHIQVNDYFAPLIEAAVLAKVIMIGDAMRLGRRFDNRPLAIPTIYRTIVFSLFIVAFSVVEHVVTALFHGKKVVEGIEELTRGGWPGLLAWYLLIIVALIPFFTVKEIEDAFGAAKIRAMFFKPRTSEDHAHAAGEGGAPSPML